eukprot:TRINITY_DN6042_c0_g1_i1.p2 TRINITY_DN6042_c0_g1~~TRINITY_DN6042_c0_g1_i1.p2  ORF type:complete len:168 (+),score=29.96 TRINITY_DN6042_c0_g1_i1:251-754(+)
MVSERLVNKVAVITGASNGIGAACANIFAIEGAKVVLADIDVEKGKFLANSINEEHAGKGRADSQLGETVAKFIKCDVTQASDLDATFAAASESFGGIDVLVNNAAVQSVKALMDTSDNEWGRIIDVNLTSVFRATKRVVPFMRQRGGGSIVNVSSTFAIVGSSGCE